MVVLDTYQSAGTVPFSVKELNTDFATGGSVKWLCGGPGAGYLYVRPDLFDKLQPKTTGWTQNFITRLTLHGSYMDRRRSLHSSQPKPDMQSSMKSASIKFARRTSGKQII
jgi:selenocysteine lyase/cysteine desulfurase